MTDAPAAASERRSARRTAFRIVTAVLGLALGVAGFALISLVLPWFVGGEREIHRVHDLGWGALGGAMLALPMILQAWAPERRLAATQQIVVAVAALFVAGAMAASISPFLAIFVIAAAALVILHPARDRLLERGRFSPLLAVLAVAAAVPLAMYALDQAEIARACPPAGDTHCDEEHWTSMAALAVALPLVGLLAAFRAPGWRIPAWTAGGAAVVFGLASLVFPDHVSALPTGWAVVALAGGAAFAGVAEMEARRSPD